MTVMFIVCENTYENVGVHVFQDVFYPLFFVFIFQNVFIMSMHFFLIRDNHKDLPQGENYVYTHRTLHFKEA